MHTTRPVHSGQLFLPRVQYVCSGYEELFRLTEHDILGPKERFHHQSPHLAVDQGTAALWISDGDRIVKLSDDGKVKLNIPLQ